MKPSHQWETKSHLAFRSDEKPVRGIEDDARAEAFDLHFHDGRRAQVRLGLCRQMADEVALSCPDLAHAVKCWLAARGVRDIALHRSAEDAIEHEVLRASFTVAELGTSCVTAPRRIISLCPSNAEMLDALGCFSRVIACEDSSDYPSRVEVLERLGPDLAPNVDRVRALAPDLVVSSLSVPGMERVVTGLRARDVRQIVLAPRSLADVLDEVERLALALGEPEAGALVRARMESEIRDLERALPESPIRVYLEWWPKPMFTPGSACYSNELIRLAGGINVFGDRPGSSVEISRDELVAAEPEACFVSWCGVALDKLDPGHLAKRSGLENVPAVVQKRIFALDERFSGRPGPRMLEAARVMAQALHRTTSLD
jgi:iron complex transport system substrate-binding protein